MIWASYQFSIFSFHCEDHYILWVPRKLPKNHQGYNFEHNYGHGKENLSVNFALLMMLAFLVDQVQQLAFPLFQAVLKKEGSRKRLWQHMRALFYTLPFSSLEASAIVLVLC